MDQVDGRSSMDRPYCLLETKDSNRITPTFLLCKASELLTYHVQSMNRSVLKTEPEYLSELVEPSLKRAAAWRVLRMLEALREEVFLSPWRLRRSYALLNTILHFTDHEQPTLALATTPLLLLIYSVVNSHSCWDRRYHHDAHTAAHVQKDLTQLLLADGFSETVRSVVTQKVAGLILLQNLYRGCVGTGVTETLVWHSGTGSNQLHYFSMGRRQHCEALLQLIAAAWFPQEPSSPKQLQAAVLATHVISLCYQKRLAPSILDQPLLEIIKAMTRLRQSLLRLLTQPKPPPEGPGLFLVTCEFLRHIFDQRSKARATMNALISNYLQRHPLSPQQLPELLCVSFGRYWATIHASWIKDLLNKSTMTDLIDVPESETPQTIGPRISLRFTMPALKREEAFKVVYGVEWKADLWTQIQDIFYKERTSALLPIDASEGAAHRGVLQHPSYPFVIHVLQMLGRFYDRFSTAGDLDFIRMRIRRMYTGFDPAWEDASTIYLPRKAIPTVEELTMLVKNGGYNNARLIVARAAAALIINHAIGIGSISQVLEELPTSPSASDNALKKWYDVIEWVARNNHHGVLSDYLSMTVTPRTVVKFTVQPRKHSDHEAPHILALDVGGTSVKTGLYALRDGALILAAGDEFPTPTPSSDAADYESNIEEVATAIVREALARFKQAGSPLEPKLASVVCVGVGWAGAVGGEPGNELVIAKSGPLSKITGIRREKLTAAHLQSIDLRQAFAQAFAAELKTELPVRLINDGFGHILGYKDHFKTSLASTMIGEVTSVVIAGTGTALGLILKTVQGDKLLPVLAEAGRLILDVVTPFVFGDVDPFPVGVGNKFFSQETFKQVALHELLRWANSFGRPTIAAELTRINKPDSFWPLFLGWITAAMFNNVTAKTTIEDLDPDIKGFVDLLNANLVALPPSQLQPISKVAGRIRKRYSDFAFDPSKPLQIIGLQICNRIGMQLAALIALTEQLFGVTEALVSGGPLKGKSGQLIRFFARKELVERYHYGVIDNLSSPPRHIAQLLRVPEPDSSSPTEPPNAYGAALAALELYRIVGQ